MNMSLFFKKIKEMGKTPQSHKLKMTLDSQKESRSELAEIDVENDGVYVVDDENDDNINLCISEVITDTNMTTEPLPLKETWKTTLHAKYSESNANKLAHDYDNLYLDEATERDDESPVSINIDDEQILELIVNEILQNVALSKIMTNKIADKIVQNVIRQDINIGEIGISLNNELLDERAGLFLKSLEPLIVAELNQFVSSTVEITNETR